MKLSFTWSISSRKKDKKEHLIRYQLLDPGSGGSRDRNFPPDPSGAVITFHGELPYCFCSGSQSTVKLEEIETHLECYQDLCISLIRAAIQGDDQEIAEARVARSPSMSETSFPRFSLSHLQCFLRLQRLNRNGFILSRGNAKENTWDCTKSSLINILKT